MQRRPRCYYYAQSRDRHRDFRASLNGVHKLERFGARGPEKEMYENRQR